MACPKSTNTWPVRAIVSCSTSREEGGELGRRTRQNACGQGLTGTVRKDRPVKVLVCSEID
jgi:hypothetical protein